MMKSKVQIGGVSVTVECDGLCDSAYGIGWKGEKTKQAPCLAGKPLQHESARRHTKWCVQECERSKLNGEQDTHG